MRRQMMACAIGLAACGAAAAQVATLPNPVMYVTQYPVANDFATIGSVFANHEADLNSTGRGGDLWIRYPDGSSRNLTQQAGFGVASGLQGATSISVRDPAVHWSGTKAVFSMAIGAPTQQFQVAQYYFQLYEVTGLGQGETAVITKVPNQPANYNNVQPTYDSRGRIVFVSDRTRGGERHLYPQHDEYESTPTPTGLWRLDPATAQLVLLQHSPSGSFTPIVDSYGRIVFTRWDHLQRDQQNDSAQNAFGTFNYASEAATVPLADRSEVFPEPRAASSGGAVNGHTINHFFPWEIRQDGTGEETLNHVGRHELQSYFNRSLSTDAALDEFIAEISGRANPNSILNVLQIAEDPTLPGRYVAIDAPEFNTHASGQVIRFNAQPSLNPDLIQIEYLTHRDTFGTTPSPNHSGHYRDPIVLTDGRILAAHTSVQGDAGNAGTRAQPQPRYQFRLTAFTVNGGTLASQGLLTDGTSKSLSFYDPDVLVTYDGPLWELQPVEVVARTVPPDTAESIATPEQQAYATEGVNPQMFREWLAEQQLAVVVMRNVTTRDDIDQQQPYKLRVPGGVQTGAGGTVYDVAHFQFFQGDQVRGIGGTASPNAGRRVLAQVLHEQAALEGNPAAAGGPPGSVGIFSDGSVAAYVPTRRAMTWQMTAPDGTPVVRERYWLTMQPGEVRACDGCHGVNTVNQAGQAAAQNVPLAFRDLLARWKSTAPVFRSGFE